jgi:hypothetical protein
MIQPRTWVLLVSALAVPAVAASVAHCESRVIDAVSLTSDFVWYVLDETQGTVAKDSSSHHYDITLTGVVWAQGANFDGVSGGGSTMPVDPSYRSPPITIAAWLTPKPRADQASTQYGLLPYPPNAIGDDSPGLLGYGIGLNVWTDGDGGSALAAEEVDMCQHLTPPTCIANQNTGDAGPFLAGREYFIVAAIGSPVDDASPLSAQLYVDGVLYDQTTAGIPGNSAQTTLHLGYHNMDTPYGSKRVFAGRIRDARVYKRQLGSAEVAQLFANGPTTRASSSVRADAASDASFE